MYRHRAVVSSQASGFGRPLGCVEIGPSVGRKRQSQALLEQSLAVVLKTGISLWSECTECG